MKILPSVLIASFAALIAVPVSAEPESSRELAIVAPAPDRTVVDDDGVVKISFAPTPALADGELIVLRVDEQIVVLPSGLTKFAMTGVPAGSHVLEAMIVDADANPLAVTQPVTFLVGETIRI